MRTILGKFYFRLMILGVLFSCESQKKEFPYQDVSERETEEIHKLINQLIEEKFHIFYYDFDSLVFLSEKASIDWKKNYMGKTYRFSQFVELQKASAHPNNKQRDTRVEDFFTEEDFQKFLSTSTQPYTFQSEYLHNIQLVDKENETAFPTIAVDSLGVNEFTHLKISRPTFFHNYKYSWIYFNQSKFSGFMSSGGGYLAVYEKENDNWKYLFSIQLVMY